MTLKDQLLRNESGLMDMVKEITEFEKKVQAEQLLLDSVRDYVRDNVEQEVSKVMANLKDLLEGQISQLDRVLVKLD